MPPYTMFLSEVGIHELIWNANLDANDDLRRCFIRQIVSQIVVGYYIYDNNGNNNFDDGYDS
ncbi:Hypothetical protein Trvi_ORF64 [Trabala vishnou gigantina nucleopolyhedrovirus]|uniref:Hypothetical protein n=1 Tax=Trabala vishnou gigantina nucleopolyhedrovirus TaxID=2863583 RepID=UPI002481B6F5|nr:Hypothetical protein QKU87_gp064 [Trabala vishnou gigantina nucleopolyhedrovirus]QYC92792.1 Hypothetical protein Trvi_ORF64 [Trabala vishnou gigantina nucleopolyhedrovirus]